jgi:hypothetical protein
LLAVYLLAVFLRVDFFAAVFLVADFLATLYFVDFFLPAFLAMAASAFEVVRRSTACGRAYDWISSNAPSASRTAQSFLHFELRRTARRAMGISSWSNGGRGA